MIYNSLLIFTCLAGVCLAGYYKGGYKDSREHEYESKEHYKCKLFNISNHLKARCY